MKPCDRAFGIEALSPRWSGFPEPYQPFCTFTSGIG